MRRFLLVLPLMLAGCAESPAERALRNSPDYQAGYRDGCSSASTQGANPRETGMVRDQAAYDGNRAYHSGWGTGFTACRLYQPSNGPALPGRGPVRDPSPGGPPF